MSKQQAKRNSVYSKQAKKYKIDNPLCVAVVAGCTKYTQDIHHKKGRTGDNLFKHWMPVCRNCHEWIESHWSESVALGWQIPRQQKDQT